jgi:hypothetical protein
MVEYLPSKHEPKPQYHRKGGGGGEEEEEGEGRMKKK